MKTLEDAWDPPLRDICFEQTSAFSSTPFNIEEEQLDFWPLLNLDPAIDSGQFSANTVPEDLLTASCQSDPKDVSPTRQPDRSTDSGEWYGNGISDNEPLAFASPPPSPSSDAASVFWTALGPNALEISYVKQWCISQCMQLLGGGRHLQPVTPLP